MESKTYRFRGIKRTFSFAENGTNGQEEGSNSLNSFLKVGRSELKNSEIEAIFFGVSVQKPEKLKINERMKKTKNSDVFTRNRFVTKPNSLGNLFCCCVAQRLIGQR
ncbi:hypothetical protein CH367_14085 [Leptospira barantonii]|uniref:Uncharacterized protein n=1 Tax=Leptospira barantonii TaxID=2023184 RepID=A0ABX4NIE5_9LEPT|nr:hypothetical protein CH367_14085 [Leptospira barantonii]